MDQTTKPESTVADPKKHNQLNEDYKNASSADEEVFAEMRSNLLLVSGNHYSKKQSSFFSKVRNSQKINETAKLRLTQNHIFKVCAYYENAITSKTPGVMVSPKNDLEMQSKKSAQLNESVWQDAKQRYNLKEKFAEYIKNFVQIGEMCAYIYFDPNKGEHRGYEPEIDPMTEQPMMDPMTGQMKADKEKPIFTGGFEFKNVPGFNLLRAPNAKNMKDSPYHIIREMVPKKELLEVYTDDAKKKIVGESDREEFVVFDTNKNSYAPEEGQVLVRFHFFKPCKAYPSGYFYIATQRGILEEGEIPYGVYPIVWEGFDTFATNPRAYSIIKVARPYQAEINRASSQAATHQVTVGDDKLIYQSGTKLAQGALLPGVRGLTYQGAAPQILAGRTGEQFIPYIQGKIQELYSACMLEEINQESNMNLQDPYAMLYRSANQKQKFAKYTEKVENFMKNFCMTYLELAKHYLPDDALISAVGKSEQINLAEFKSTKSLDFMIKIEEQSEDIDTRMGRQIALQHVLQYSGSQLTSKQQGLVMKEMPFLSNSSLFKRLSIDYDNVENDMLQLERGQMPFVTPYAENQVYVDAVTHRMKQPDFNMLPPNVQQLYDQYLQIHEDQLKSKADAAQAAKDGFIPTGGALITLSMQVADPSTSSGTRQVRLPYEACNWLMQKLETQGSTLQAMEGINQGVIADMYQGQPQQGQPGPQPQQPQLNAPSGQMPQ